jgi:hypothetical protein
MGTMNEGDQPLGLHTNVVDQEVTREITDQDQLHVQGVNLELARKKKQLEIAKYVVKDIMRRQWAVRICIDT